MLKIKQIEFVKSCVSLNDRPRRLLPEFAFAGRSNVGKSSLINCLVNRKNIAKVSKRPGKTRTINYFVINNQFYLVDLPGYGFARVSHGELRQWKRMLEEFILKNDRLVKLYVLIDALVGLQKNDLQLFEWLNHYRIPFHIVATKADRINNTARIKLINTVMETLRIKNKEAIILFSSKTRLGRDQLLTDIAHALRSSEVGSK